MDKDRDAEPKTLATGETAAPSPVTPEHPADQLPSQGSLKDSKLISFGERITYTFIWAKEVHSIHFDRKREEIFYRGHNIKNLELTGEQIQLLIHLKDILSRDQHSRNFLIPYDRILRKLLREKGYSAKF